MPFSEITGHEHNIKVLQRSIKRSKVHHAYIFSGPEGIGKRLAAVSLAKALNCAVMEDDFCGHCVSCKKIDDGNHPDVKIVEPDGQYIKIDQIRELQHDLQYRPFEGKKRIFIIDSADRMGLPAANSLLKTLEEPPDNSILILVTANLHSLLPTIVSRSLKLNFASLSIADVERTLVEKKGLEAGQARIIAAITEGSIGKALSEDERSLIDGREKVFSTFTGLKGKSMVGIFKKAEELAKDDELVEILRTLKIFYRDMAVSKGGGDIINSDMASRIEDESEKLPIEAILDGFNRITETEELLKRNINKQLALEVMMMRLMSLN